MRMGVMPSNALDDGPQYAPLGLDRGDASVGVVDPARLSFSEEVALV